MSEIRNVVFDIGNVLINYTPGNVLESFKELDSAGCDILDEYVFSSKIWLDLDRGSFSLMAAADMITDLIPAYEKYVRKILNGECFGLMFSEKPETVKFMRELKAEGYNTYLLSNFSREGFDYVESIYDFLSEPDGRIISAHVGLIKPEREIYDLLLGKYSLNPEETVFIDDLPQNCAAAEAVGIKTICFKGHDELRKEFEKYKKTRI